MNLFAFQPNGHGQLSFFVCAEDEETARAHVDQQVGAIRRANGEVRGWGSHDDYETTGWGTDYYTLSVHEPGSVAYNDND